MFSDDLFSLGGKDMRYLLMSCCLLCLSTQALADCTDPALPEATMFYNKDHKTMQFCDGTTWWDMKSRQIAGAGDSALCGGAGGLCADGSVYAGVSPDGHAPLYTTPENAPGTYRWGPNGNTAVPDCDDWDDAGCITGAANTAVLAALAGAYDAAKYCANLNAYGHDDWYLPSLRELYVLYWNGRFIGGLRNWYESGDNYLSSSEASSTDAWHISDGDDYEYGKTLNDYYVRCVRK
jgi:hypothetical protein